MAYIIMSVEEVMVGEEVIPYFYLLWLSAYLEKIQATVVMLLDCSYQFIPITCAWSAE